MGDGLQLDRRVTVDITVCHSAGGICNHLSVARAASRIQDAAFSISSSVCSTVTTTLMLERFMQRTFICQVQIKLITKIKKKIYMIFIATYRYNVIMVLWKMRKEAVKSVGRKNKCVYINKIIKTAF